MNALPALIGVVVLLVASQTSGGSEPGAVRVHALIKEFGARQALLQIFADLQSEQALADGIATGHRDWLAIAAEFRPVSDGASSEVLNMAIQEALPRNPAGVLQLVRGGVFDAKDACGMYGFGQIEDERPTAVILGLVDLRLKAVAAVAEPSLEQQKVACLSELRHLRSRLQEKLGRGDSAAEQGLAPDEGALARWARPRW